MDMKRIYPIILVASLFLSSYLRFITISYTYSDENVYIYMADLILQGKMPYRDFFLAHPPFFVYSIAFFQLLFNDFFLGARMMCLFYSALSSVLVYLIVKNITKSGLSSLISCLLFQFSNSYFTILDKVLGFEMGIFFVLLSLYLYLREKPLLSGVFLGIAIMSRLFSVLLLAVYFLNFLMNSISFAKNKLKIKFETKNISVFYSCVAVLVFAVVLFSFFSDFISQVFLFHISKTSWPFSDRLYSFWLFVRMHWHIFFTALPCFYLASNKKIRLAVLCLSAFVAGILVQNIVFQMYFTFILPFIAICSAVFFNSLKKQRIFQIALIVLFLSGIIPQKEVFYMTYEHQSIPYLVDFIKKNSLESDTINGYSTIAPIISLISGRKITADYVDTTNKRFEAGSAGVQDFINILESNNAKYILCLKDAGICGLNEFNFYLQQNCTPVYEIFDQNKGLIQVWQRNKYL